MNYEIPANPQLLRDIIQLLMCAIFYRYLENIISHLVEAFFFVHDLYTCRLVVMVNFYAESTTSESRVLMSIFFQSTEA